VCTCGVNRRAYGHVCGLNSRALGARLMGAKLIFFGYILKYFMVNMGELGLYYVVVGDHLHDASPLERAGLVTAKGCRGY
jgi:hypothetical protein